MVAQFNPKQYLSVSPFQWCIYSLRCQHACVFLLLHPWHLAQSWEPGWYLSNVWENKHLPLNLAFLIKQKGRKNWLCFWWSLLTSLVSKFSNKVLTHFLSSVTHCCQSFSFWSLLYFPSIWIPIAKCRINLHEMFLLISQSPSQLWSLPHGNPACLTLTSTAFEKPSMLKGTPWMWKLFSKKWGQT